MVFIGQEVTNIEFEAFHEEQIKPMKLSDFKGKWLAIVFYPADFTYVCPTELEDLAKLYDQFKEEGCEILSVSTDKVVTHKAWHDSSEAIKKVNYPMVADPNGTISRMFGVYLEDVGEALRGSFLIDPDGILRTIEIHHNDIGRSAKELLRKLKAAKFVREHGGEVCPANWEPGEKTLKPGLDLVGKI